MDDSSRIPPLPEIDVRGADGLELRKPHEMIVMVPRSKRVTLTGRRIYNALLQVSQARLSAMENMPSADYMFEAPLPALLRTTGSSGEDRTAAKRYLREMRGLEVDWESTAPGDGVKWRGFSMLSEVAIEVRNGENWVSWSYPPTIMAALREPKRWARIDLDVLASLSSYTSVALYEICARYRDNPGGLTSRKPTAWWADALSQAPAGAERREWRKFKNERVKPAVEEINAETELEIELIEHKQGRAVMEVQFAVRKKKLVAKQQTADLVDANLVLRAESLGIRELKLEGLIKEFGEAAVRGEVEVLERRAANARLRGIDNAYSYLRSLLRNTSGVPDQEVGAHIELETQIPSQPIGVLRPAVGAPVLPRQIAVQPNPESSWMNRRIGAIKDEIRKLTTERRNLFVEAAVHELTEKRMMNAIISRRVAQGDVLHGMLGSIVVKHYALAVYGDDWDKPGLEKRESLA
jgi:hypothetical protein